MIVYYKEKNAVQQININLNPIPPNQHAFNTSKYNKSIMNSPILITHIVIAALLTSFYALKSIDYEEGISMYRFLFVYHVIAVPICKILTALVILYTNPGMWNLMFRDFLNLQNPHLVHVHEWLKYLFWKSVCFSTRGHP